MYDKFEALLRERGVRAADVARATGITTTTLSAWKNGKYEPKNDKIQKIAEYFGVPITYFFDDTPAYYFDEETAKLAEEMQRPGVRRLLDATRGLSQESLETLAQTIEALKKTNPDG